MAIQFLEKNLEDIIYETSDSDLCDRGLWIEGKRFRQLRIGKYGVADMVTVKKETYHSIITKGKMTPYLMITVYELKQNLIDANTLMQAFRYCKGIERYIKSHRKKHIQLKFKVVLIGKNVSGGDFSFLPDFLENIDVITYNYRFDGITFNCIGSLKYVEEGFE